jgi:hypothetical protein
MFSLRPHLRTKNSRDVGPPVYWNRDTGEEWERQSFLSKVMPKGALPTTSSLVSVTYLACVVAQRFANLHASVCRTDSGVSSLHRVSRIAGLIL